MSLLRKQLGVELINKWRSTQLPSNFTTVTLPDLIERVREIAANACNRPHVEVFGGLVSGFATSGADADLSLTFSGANPLLQGLEHYDNFVNKKLMRFGERASDAGMLACRHVNAKIPVVQFEDAVTNIVCDVSVTNFHGVENSNILRRIHDEHEVIGAYIWLVKHWAKNKEIIAPEKGCFNSFTVTCMALMVLQEVLLLPVFSLPSGQLGELTFSDVEMKLKATPKHPALAGLNPQDDEAMGDAILFLLTKFAEFYSAVDLQNGCVSLIAPRRLRSLYAQDVTAYLEALKEQKRFAWSEYSKEANLGEVDENELSNAMHYESSQRPANNTPFVVVDFVNHVNCGRRVKLPREKHVRDGFASLKQMMANAELTAEELLRPEAKLKQVVTDFNRDGDRRVTRFG